MNPTISELRTKLDEIDQYAATTEQSILVAIEGMRNPDLDDIPCAEWEYEILAFRLVLSARDSESIWGTRFSPQSVWIGGEGNRVGNPRLEEIDNEAIEYWLMRSEQTCHPLLRSRYLALTWDLSYAITGVNPHYMIGRNCCLATFEVADEKLHKHPVSTINLLEYALSIALRLNADDLIAKSVKTIIDFENCVADDTKPGLWGFAYDLLIENRSVKLNLDIEEHIIRELEERLQRLEGGDIWACEKAAERLARYYQAKGRLDDRDREILVLGRAVEIHAENSNAMIAHSALEHMYRIYRQHGLMQEANRTAIGLQALGPKLRANMVPIEHTGKIDNAQLQKFINTLVTESLHQTMENIALHFVPQRSQVRDQVLEISKTTPVLALIRKTIVDHRGRTIAIVGSVDDDIDGNIVRQMSQNMTISSIFLARVLDNAILKLGLNADTTVQYLLDSPIYPTGQDSILATGLRSYFKSEFLTAIHVLVPYIESAVRNLFELCGGATYKPARDGGFMLRTLDEVLRTPIIENVFADDISLYLRVTLTDRRGWNIRNNVCHGLFPDESFSKSVCDRLIHVLLLLRQVNEKDEPTTDAEETCTDQ